jgi:hypothetical protein
MHNWKVITGDPKQVCNCGWERTSHYNNGKNYFVYTKQGKNSIWDITNNQEPKHES